MEFRVVLIVSSFFLYDQLITKEVEFFMYLANVEIIYRSLMINTFTFQYLRCFYGLYALLFFVSFLEVIF